jgi:hypothetical protein
VKNKALIVILLVVCFTLAGALYATAAPSGPPRVEIAVLRAKLKMLERRVDALSSRLFGAECVGNLNWVYLGNLYDALSTGAAIPNPSDHGGCL